MEKITIYKNDTKSENITNLNNKLILENRKILSLSGVQEVYSTNETSIYLKAGNFKMIILGNNISISKLEIESGIIEATGTFNSIKFADNNSGFLKRIFK